MRPLILLAGCLAAGCATLPARPDVSFFVHQDPLMVPDPTVAPKRMGARLILPPPVPAPMCLTEKDYQALQAYFDRVAAARAR